MYGYLKVGDDLRALDKQCGIDRVHRPTRTPGKAVIVQSQKPCRPEATPQRTGP